MLSRLPPLSKWLPSSLRFASPPHPHFSLQFRSVVYNKITKNKLLLNKHRDAAFENLMDDEKKMNLMKRIVNLLLKQPEQKMLLRFMLRRGGYVGLVKPQKISDILQKYPRIIRIYRNPQEIDVWVTIAKPMLQLLEDEKNMKRERAHLAAERLRKVLMLSTTRRIRLDRIKYIKEELALPDDFKQSVIKANPHLFKLVIARKDIDKLPPSVKLLDWDPQCAVPAIDSYRENPATTSGLDEYEKKKKAYSFPINLPPGFKIKKGFRIKMRKWQELPHRSPYDDTSDLDLQSEEAFKRAVAVVHEFLHITVEKRTRVDRLAHLREDYKLSQKLGITVLQNPGIFYMSIKGNVQTIFLREGYKRGQLINKDATFSLKERFMELIKIGCKSVKNPRKEITDSDTSEDEADGDARSDIVEMGMKRDKDEGLKTEDEEDGMKHEGEDDGMETDADDVCGDSDDERKSGGENMETDEESEDEIRGVETMDETEVGDYNDNGIVSSSDEEEVLTEHGLSSNV